MEFFSLLLISCILTGQQVEASQSKQYSPIILIPGASGSKVEAKLHKPSSEHGCPLQSDWSAIWANISMILSTPQCFIENFRLIYDNTTRKTSNAPGVETRIPDFGNTSAVEFLDDSQKFGKNFFPLVEHLVKKRKYRRGISLRAAPYDFRKSPNELADYFSAYRRLVNETYVTNSNRKVVLLGHNMGALITLYFLNRQSSEWKKNYIKAFVSVGAPYGGSVNNLRAMVSGGEGGIQRIEPNRFRDVLRSMTSMAWLMPYEGFWERNEVLLRGPSRNYSVNHYRALFDDIGFPTGVQMRRDTVHLIKNLRHPEVDVHCLYGVNVSTLSGLSYSSWESDPSTVNGNGDGSVNLRSLEGCKRWVGMRNETVSVQSFKGAGQLKILRRRDFLTYLAGVLEIQ